MIWFDSIRSGQLIRSGLFLLHSAGSLLLTASTTCRCDEELCDEFLTCGLSLNPSLQNLEGENEIKKKRFFAVPQKSQEPNPGHTKFLATLKCCHKALNGRNKDMFPCPEEEEDDEEEEVETLSVTSFFPRTGALQEESKTKTQNTRKKLSRKSKNGSQLEANQTKPNQPRETKNKQNPGVSLTHSLSLLQQRKSNLCESNRLKHQQQQQQQAWRARSNLLVLMMIDQSSKHKSRECHRNSQIYRRRRTTTTTTTSPHTNKPIITFHPFLSSPAFHYLSPRLHLLPPTETSQPIPSEWCSDRVLRL